jgi:hypothetical protein
MVETALVEEAIAFGVPVFTSVVALSPFLTQVLDVSHGCHETSPN